MITALPEFKKRMGNIKPGKKQITPPFEGQSKGGKDLNKAQKKEKSKITAKQ